MKNRKSVKSGLAEHHKTEETRDREAFTGGLKMKLGKLVLAPIAAAIMAFSMDSGAAVASWDLNVADPSAGLGSGPWGTVTLTENGANEVDVSVTLSNASFLSTADNHNAFVFSLSDTSSAVVSVLTAGFSVDGVLPDWNTPFGTFTNGILCASCGNGATNPNPGPLAFSVTDTNGISISSFIASTSPPPGQGGYLFSADVFANGATGNVAAIPEPETYAMLLAGLGLMAFVARRRRQSLGNLVPA